MVVDDYEKVARKAGGTAETSLQLTIIDAAQKNERSRSRSTSPTPDWKDEKEMKKLARHAKRMKVYNLTQELKTLTNVQPGDAPRGRCGMICDLCETRPCMLAEEHEGSTPPKFGGCRCPVAMRGEDCTSTPPRRPMRFTSNDDPIETPGTSSSSAALNFEM